MRLKILLAFIILTSQSVAGENTFYLDSPYNDGTLRLEIDNDLIWSRDSNFTSGWSIQYHTVRYNDWENAAAPPFCKWIGLKFPTLSDNDTIVRLSHGVGQIMITPEDITNPNPLEGDLPYAGTLTYSLNWQSFNRQIARNFQITVGVIGEESYAGSVHEFLHDVWRWGENPNGWHTQRETEPAVNLGYQHVWRLAKIGIYTNDWAGQIYLGTTGLLGNLMTSLDVGFGFRVGWNMQEGFTSFPAPPGVGIFQSAHIPKPGSASPHGIELVAGVRGMGLVYSVIYDGSLFNDDDRQVERENFVFSGLFGLNYHYYKKLSLRLALVKTSDLLIEQRLPTPRPGQKKTNTDNSFGTLMIDFHF